MDSFSPFPRFQNATTTQPPFCQVIHRQCSHCLFIFVFVVTSNPTLSRFSPPAGSVSAACFDVEPQFIRLSHWILPLPPLWPCNMSQSIITWPTYLPPPANALAILPPGSDRSDMWPTPDPWKSQSFTFNARLAVTVTFVSVTVVTYGPTCWIGFLLLNLLCRVVKIEPMLYAAEGIQTGKLISCYTTDESGSNLFPLWCP